MSTLVDPIIAHLLATTPVKIADLLSFASDSGNSRSNVLKNEVLGSAFTSLADVFRLTIGIDDGILAVTELAVLDDIGLIEWRVAKRTVPADGRSTYRYDVIIDWENDEGYPLDNDTGLSDFIGKPLSSARPIPPFIPDMNISAFASDFLETECDFEPVEWHAKTA